MQGRFPGSRWVARPGSEIVWERRKDFPRYFRYAFPGPTIRQRQSISRIAIGSANPVTGNVIGIPAFSVSEGMKYQGHDLAWGQAEAKDYVEHRYHQPTDIYTPDMDFRGDAVMAQFGYALGQKAANASTVPVWLPGDEFAPAQKQRQAQAAKNVKGGA